ncbi:NAD(P)-dependent oxidoreductase [Algoriphagus aestuarii]|nr:NAD(P)-dependent oxidoreductase [Algoriphagus aestuarii]
MKYLLTGASGFLGNYINKSLSGKVLSLGRSKSNDFQFDLSVEVPELTPIDMVIHSAGLAHRIPKNKEEESQFYKVNLDGTKNLIAALDQLDRHPQTFVFISSVAVYGLDQGKMVLESTQLNPQTPYGKSKRDAELFLIQWAEQREVNLVILRLPLIAGGENTPGNLGAMIKAIKNNYYFRVGDGFARKSVVLAEDIAKLIPSLHGKQGVFNLTDGQHPSLAELDKYLSGFYKKKVRKINFRLLQYLAKIGDLLPFFPLNTYRLEKLSHSLTFDDQEARKNLGWNPRPVISNLDLKS